MKIGNSLCLLAFVLIALAGITLATQASASSKPREGRIKGTILDRNEARVAGATIIVVSTETNWKGLTNAEGEFKATVPAGEYRIYVAANGFHRFESDCLTVKSGATRTVSFHLVVREPELWMPPGAGKGSSSGNRPCKPVV